MCVGAQGDRETNEDYLAKHWGKNRSILLNLPVPLYEIFSAGFVDFVKKGRAVGFKLRFIFSLKGNNFQFSSISLSPLVPLELTILNQNLSAITWKGFGKFLKQEALDGFQH